MKQAKQLLAAVLALGLSALSASAELVTQGVGILDTKLNVIWTKDANLLATLEGSTPASYSALVTAIIAANNGTIEDVKNYYDGDSKKYVLSADRFRHRGLRRLLGRDRLCPLSEQNPLWRLKRLGVAVDHGGRGARL